MENKPRIIRLCNYYNYHEEYPSLRLRGKYLRDFGFSIGDQVTVTNPAPGKMIVEVTRTNDEINEELERKQAMIERLVKQEMKRLRA